MAKTVFRPGEAKNIEEKVMLPLYKDYSPIEEAIVEEEEEYTGPTAEDLRREAEEERNNLNAAILFYGLSVFWEGRGDEKQAAELRRETLARESVWPCVASLAARRDEQAGKERQRK